MEGRQYLESDHDNPEKKGLCKHSPGKKRNGDTWLAYSGRTALKREQYGVFAPCKKG
jgi:hypothetical protein